MNRIIRSKKCPFSFFSWNFKGIKKVYAGNSCVMAITKKHRVLQKAPHSYLEEDVESWNSIESISISQHHPALAVGLRYDGTCVVTKRALNQCCRVNEISFDQTLDKISKLKDIVQVCVSDAIFALDHYGMVHLIPLDKDNDYNAVKFWTNITHISTGLSNSIYAVDCTGAVICTGYNCISGPQGNQNIRLSNIKDAVEVCPLGSECEEVIIAHRNGSVTRLDGTALNIEHSGNESIFVYNYRGALVSAPNNKYKHVCYYGMSHKHLSKLKGKKLSDVALGFNRNHGNFFYVAITK